VFSVNAHETRVCGRRYQFRIFTDVMQQQMNERRRIITVINYTDVVWSVSFLISSARY